MRLIIYYLIRIKENIMIKLEKKKILTKKRIIGIIRMIIKNIIIKGKDLEIKSNI